ncbi:MAG TPA: acyl-CoA dehydrogenase [Porticoccaceae bacterium]|nr:acyl-CoA dehydrogenase [Porticoccaceae bacterium]HCO58572.1 acyl-CoA dehydrogenase [Porticoccaceae bacterium]
MTPYQSQWMDENLEVFRRSVSQFVETEMLPYDEKWREQQHLDKDLWRKAGAQGFLCTDIPDQYGGGGADFRYEAVFYEEQWRRGLSGMGQGVHSISAHYILNHGTEEQKHRWLPKMASGEMIGAIAMTEPGTGSDLQGIVTRAVKDGDHYVVNGSKIFITNGYLCELLVLVVRTDPNAGSKGLSLLVLETEGLEGFRVGRKLKKLGQKAQDTCELFFEDVRVHESQLLGGVEGQGFIQLMSDLPYERSTVGVQAIASMEGTLEETVRYVKERHAFGKALIEQQNTRFKLAELYAQVRAARIFMDRCIEDVVSGRLDNVTASMSKWWLTELQQKVVDECLQLHGGYGYMDEYLVCRMYADARVARIYAGTSEIMLEVIARDL